MEHNPIESPAKLVHVGQASPIWLPAPRFTASVIIRPPAIAGTSRGRSGQLTTSIETIHRGGARRPNTRYGDRPPPGRHDPAQS